MSRPGHDSEKGFALAEALVALAIFATMTGLLFESVVSSISLRQHISEKKMAVMIARSAIDQIEGDNRPLATGRSGNLSWSAEVSRYSNGDAFGGGRLEQVTVSVSNRQSGRVVLRVKSLKVAGR